MADNALPENSKENLDRKLDYAIEETFPTSDPISVSITKGGAIDYEREDHAASASVGSSGQEGQSTPEHLLRRAKETVSGMADSASEAARDAYDQGRRYAREARERYPQAERFYREGTEAVRHQASEHPLLTLLVGVGIGYALALMLHSSRSRQTKGVPEYARTERGYSPHWPQPRA